MDRSAKVRIEYLDNDVAMLMRPDLRGRSSPCQSFAHSRGYFIFGGHRLFNLCRKVKDDSSKSIKRYTAITTLQKYSFSCSQGAMASERSS